MKKNPQKTSYFYDMGNGLTLMNVLTKDESGKLDRVDTYVGVEGYGFSQVGEAKNLAAPGAIFKYSSYVREQERYLSFYKEAFEKNTGVKIRKGPDGYVDVSSPDGKLHMFL